MAKGKDKDLDWPDLDDIEIEIIEFDSVKKEFKELTGSMKIVPSSNYKVVDTIKIKDPS